MISQRLNDAINEQINREFYSEYLYLAMQSFFERENLDGFANFFSVQTQEEHAHALKFFNFVNTKGGTVKLGAIKAPPMNFTDATSVFEQVLEHELYITRSVNELMTVAVEEKDYATQSFLQWFIDEQVEEEATMEKILSQLKLIKGTGHGLYMLDKELATRVFNQPTQN